jgi:hypothetical protein
VVLQLRVDVIRYPLHLGFAHREDTIPLLPVEVCEVRIALRPSLLFDPFATRALDGPTTSAIVRVRDIRCRICTWSVAAPIRMTGQSVFLRMPVMYRQVSCRILSKRRTRRRFFVLKTKCRSTRARDCGTMRVSGVARLQRADSEARRVVGPSDPRWAQV